MADETELAVHVEAQSSSAGVFQTMSSSGYVTPKQGIFWSKDDTAYFLSDCDWKCFETLEC